MDGGGDDSDDGDDGDGGCWCWWWDAGCLRKQEGDWRGQPGRLRLAQAPSCLTAVLGIQYKTKMQKL